MTLTHADAHLPAEDGAHGVGGGAAVHRRVHLGCEAVAGEGREVQAAVGQCLPATPRAHREETRPEAGSTNKDASTTLKDRIYVFLLVGPRVDAR